MATDQHFCLRWNNHQSTLISVFDTLLESGTLVDCTLAADGQQLKAHKVVLSACSPYLEALLSQHYDKHPIIILRDVKFPELKAMLDYMYRGEVNITQEQLGTFLKAAESLQIKGLTDSGGGGGGGGVDSKRNDIRKQLTMPPAAVTPQTRPRGASGGEVAARKSAVIPGHMMDVAPSSPLKAREGSVSPVVKKRRKPDHPQHNDDARLVQTTDNGNSPSSEAPSDEPPLLLNNTANNNNSWPPKVVDNNASSVTNNKEKSATAAALAAVKCEDLLQPKAEFIDDDMNDNDNSADDDDDDEVATNKMDASSKPGPSHSANTQGYQSWMEDDSSNEESGASNNQQNSQGYGQWHVSTDGSADETMMTAPPQDSQDKDPLATTEKDGTVAVIRTKPLTVAVTPVTATEPSTATERDPLAITEGDPLAITERDPLAITERDPLALPGRYACMLCNKSYLWKQSLTRHIREDRCDRGPQHLCPNCGMNFKHTSRLVRHMPFCQQAKFEYIVHITGKSKT